ncbi:hypothetical protein CFK41_11100 [Brachybacterium ginsengisoli]|uniref:Uncharacterized protein n=1 Tax=Brachybacterium ginsengisoli TaxID=1331682 RepID=A0A291GYH6_9MICO|nr:hypothetical protein [Brachybacterium ginsengisoli]ATG55248.1 hypothetical protein CFK41_11100 [Brachybacterium ginsengisoli]
MLDHLRERGTLGVAVAASLLLVLAGAPRAVADPGAEPAVPEEAYTAAGAEIAGGASIAQAPTITPGAYRDSFAAGAAEYGTSGTVKYYRVDLAEGERVHAAATIAAPPYADGLPAESEPLDLRVSVVTADGTECEDSEESDIGEPQTGVGAVTSVAVSSAVGPDGCAGEALYVAVARSGSRLMDTPLPVEVQVAVQPTGIGGSAPVLEEPVEDAGASPVAPESSDPLSPGRSFADPLVVEPGSVVLELLPGETAVLSLSVAEGQRLRWRTEVTAAPANAGDLSLQVHDATRDLVTVGGGRSSLSSVGAVSGGGMAAPVDRGNRGSDDLAIASAWLPGQHTVMLSRVQRSAESVAEDPEGDDPVRLILTLEVEGDPAEGAAEGSVLELGDATMQHGPLSALGIDASWSRLAAFAGAGALTMLGVLSGLAGVLVLRHRRR